MLHKLCQLLSFNLTKNTWNFIVSFQLNVAILGGLVSHSSDLQKLGIKYFRKMCSAFLNCAGALAWAKNRPCLQFTPNVSFRIENNRISIPRSRCRETWHISHSRYGWKNWQEIIEREMTRFVSCWFIEIFRKSSLDSPSIMMTWKMTLLVAGLALDSPISW